MFLLVLIFLLGKIETAYFTRLSFTSPYKTLVRLLKYLCQLMKSHSIERSELGMNL